MQLLARAPMKLVMLARMLNLMIRILLPLMLPEGLDSTGRKPELVDRLMDFAVRGAVSAPVKKACRTIARDVPCTLILPCKHRQRLP